ncbi:calcium/sodium antiporter [uncultured Thioclava sp.]|jgi:cation:H+ antiporter|uniref:Calcium/sodium antiporter n=1 Tax=Thioclava arctica TaxID=3238301 RepID=A0ABV3TK83_9RHOB|nr:calcium/sodium antiporter [uncultured Thioclava sp.]
MIWDVGYIAVGLVFLVLAGDLLVKGAVALSLRFGIPALIVGLTVVAFGTSAPELMVSVAAVLDHAPTLALGNVVGSNIANILLVLGLPAIISAIRTDEQDMRESFVLMIGATVLFIIVAYLGPIGWPHALVLLSGLGVILFRQIREALAHRANREPDDEIASVDPHTPGWRISLLLLAGLVGLPIGADLLVEGASNIASAMGVSDAVIGLTLVALGTSLPELATSVTAAIKGRSDVALGNVVGSNIFNLLCIIGVAGMFGKIPVPAQMLHFDLWVMLGASVVLAPFIFGNRKIGRWVGVAFTLAYLVYIVALLLGGRV